MYADDTVIFLSPIKEDIDKLKEILRFFGEVTRLKININKSIVIPIHCQTLNLDVILQNFPTARKHLPCVYLGLPLTLRNLRRVQLQPLLDKVEARLERYKEKMLSKAGRFTILKSVLTVLPICHLTITDLLAWARKQIDKRRRASTPAYLLQASATSSLVVVSMEGTGQTLEWATTTHRRGGSRLVSSIHNDTIRRWRQGKFLERYLVGL